MADAAEPFSVIPSEITSNLRLIQWTELSVLSSFMVLVYDYILTFDREVTSMWPSRWGFGKILFFLTRYFSLIVMGFVIAVMFWPSLTDDLCLAWIRWHWIGGTTIAVLTELTMTLRVYAMYGRSRKITILLSISFLATFVTAFTIIVKIMTIEKADANPFHGLLDTQFCIPVDAPRYHNIFWIPLLIYEVILFVLAVIKGYQNLRMYKLRDHPGRLTLMLVRDSMFYFVVVFAAFLSNELVWVIGGVDYIEIPIGFAIAMGSIMSQRLLLNLRERYGGLTHESTSISTESTRFAIPIQFSPGVDHDRDDSGPDIMLSTFHHRSHNCDM